MRTLKFVDVNEIPFPLLHYLSAVPDEVLPVMFPDQSVDDGIVIITDIPKVFQFLPCFNVYSDRCGSRHIYHSSCMV